MTAIERKQLLLQRLLAVTDERQLEAIEMFMDKQCPDDVLYFSPELRARIDLSLQQMEEGKVYTTEEMSKRLSRWSD
ncbi:MAG: hypothetical protein J6C87_10840 [Bacteroides sp.]|nr:hypothetical protein [Bacteroides sp.]